MKKLKRFIARFIMGQYAAEAMVTLTITLFVGLLVYDWRIPVGMVLFGSVMIVGLYIFDIIWHKLEFWAVNNDK